MTSQGRTGRTTRMLEEAKRLAVAGHKVTIIAAHSLEVQRIKQEADRLGCPAGIRFLSVYDFERLRRGRPKDEAVLVDHYAEEYVKGKDTAGFTNKEV